ncbi:ATP-binding cassette domain-containing protein [bacterium]|nr:ATP-binding cassette domain-containing protein [bacterium]
MILVNVALMWIGVVYWLNGTLTLGDLALIQSSLTLVFGKLWGLGRSFRHIFDSMADGKEMVDLMREPHEVRDAKKAKALRVRLGAIDFKRVTFRFHKKRCVLDNFSLSIKPREKIALVGPSGAGKTTITKLLFRFYDVDSGSIRIDGQDIGGVTQDSLRNAVSLVPQDPVLFHRTLMDNIRYGRPDASNEEVMQAARQAHCHEFIEALPEGYGTYVGERGVKLSGGERQRVAIARAILKNAPILVLDEATSSLDSESESLIQSALHSLMRDKTVIVVAHRLSTIMAMDRILVIENGAIASQGTHAQLLKQKGTYQKLWDIQAGGFAE